MYKILKTSLIVLSSLTCSISFAGIEKCSNLPNQSALNNCSSNVLNSANQKINTVYANYMKELSPTEKLQLKDAQRAWIQYKEKDCQFQSSPVLKGSLYPFVHNACLVKKTETRIKELQDMQECRSGNEPGCL
ncbi:lysozyme inhibitor LprI family protein [Acinetobacter calcoaceticus]|uniref:lysozyme inhibitor LprI family protein n=1 Tax=Acinetobacter calcoaceticus TaxID=471 RepID=UPI00192C68F9|nr:lysozyme inhibitor LprI family protein [Acinetobacter calcoaceticus]